MSSSRDIERNLVPRFCLYAVLRNMRFFDPFIFLFFLVDLDLAFTTIGALLAYEKMLLVVLEIPLAAILDRFGRRRGLMVGFGCAGIACLGLGYSAQTAHPLPWVVGALTLYGVGEALRTGTHKAIILDWLTQRGERDRKTDVIGLTRFFSKATAGLTALVAGTLVWWTGGFAITFWLAAVPTLGVVALIASYPVALEGSLTRTAKTRPRDGVDWRGIWRSVRRREWCLLILPSVLFESQIKLVGYYLQPALAEAFADLGWAVLGVGALGVGAYAGISGLLAGSASLFSAPLLRRVGDARRVLRDVHLLGAVAVCAAAVGLMTGVVWPSLVILVGLAGLQNLRRPIFVAAFDTVMEPDYRATHLSIESQARSAVYSLTALCTGFLADLYGLAAAFAVMASLLGLAVVSDRVASRGSRSPAP